MRRLAKAKLPRKLKVQLEIRLIGIGVLLMLPTFYELVSSWVAWDWRYLDGPYV